MVRRRRPVSLSVQKGRRPPAERGLYLRSALPLPAAGPGRGAPGAASAGSRSGTVSRALGFARSAPSGRFPRPHGASCRSGWTLVISSRGLGPERSTAERRLPRGARIWGDTLYSTEISPEGIATRPSFLTTPTSEPDPPVPRRAGPPAGPRAPSLAVASAAARPDVRWTLVSQYPLSSGKSEAGSGVGSVVTAGLLQVDSPERLWSGRVVVNSEPPLFTSGKG